MKITLKDIAEETGYSISTVSRVLNGEVKSDTRAKEKILKSAKKMRYIASQERTEDLITRKLNVALIASGFHAGEFYTLFFHGMNRAAKAYKICLHLIGLLNPEELETIFEDISYNYFDGIILFVPELERKDYEIIKNKLNSDIPVISNAYIENPIVPTVIFDGYSGGHMVAEYFGNSGYHHVGIIKGSMERSEARFRYNGFRDFVEHDSTMELIWEYNGDFTFESGVEAFHHFDECELKPEAIFACNDDMGNGFLEMAKQKQYKIPQDIALVGYDNLQLCEHNQPKMSTVKTDYKQLGLTTMKVLHDNLSDSNQPDNLLSFVNVSLKLRDSS